MSVGSISGASSPVDFNPTDVADIAPAAAASELQVAVLKNQQDMMRVQGQELARLIEPNKGQHLDAYA